MALNDRAVKLCKNAYQRVNNIYPEDGTQEHTRMMSALTDVWSFKGTYDCESEEDADNRLQIDGPIKGEVTALAQHFRELEPGKYGSLANWDVIFMMQNEFEQKSVDGSEENPEAIPSTDEVKEMAEAEENSQRMNEAEAKSTAEVSSDKNITNQQGGIKMAGEHFDADGQELANKGKGLGDLFGGGKDNPSDPVSSDDNLNRKAVAEVMESSQQARNAMSRNSRVSRIILSQPPASEIFIDGLKAKGVAVNPEKTLGQFKQKTGYVEETVTDTSVSPEGKEVTKNVLVHRFTKLPAGQEEAAEAMLKLLTDLVVDRSIQLDAMVSDKPGSVKLFEVIDPEGKSNLKTPAELTDFLLLEAAGWLDINKSEGTQVKLAKYNVSEKRRRANTTPVNRGNKVANQWSGVVSTKIAGRATAIEHNSGYYKTINKEDKSGKGVRAQSQLCVQIWATDKQGQQIKDDLGNYRKRSFRIPLEVMQYALSVTEQRLLDKCPLKSGIMVTPFNPDDTTAAKEMSDLFVNAFTAAVKGKAATAFAEGSVLFNVLQRSAEMATAKAEADSNEIGGVEDDPQ